MKESEVISILKRGGTGVLPTDTLYGVVAVARSKSAVERIYKLKGRDENKPFIILISSVQDLAFFGISRTLASAFKTYSEESRRPTSIILPVPTKKFEYLHRGTKSLAFRLPKNKRLISILKKTGPLIAPSANPQGMEPARIISEAKKYFGKEVDFYLAGGRKEGRPSRVVSLVSGKLEILRK